MKLQKIQCTDCGAPVDWDGTYGQSIECVYCGTRFVAAATSLDDVWLMTDLVARARYEFEGTLEVLERDIRFEVMRG